MTGSEFPGDHRSAPKTTVGRFVALVASVGLLAMITPFMSSRSATATPDVDGNPDLPQQCGTDMTLIVDRSGSIGEHNTTVAGAANALVSGLAGTGSKVQVISFSDVATALADGNGDTDSDDLADLAFVPAESLTVPTFPSGGNTNWDDALEMARRSPVGVAPLTVVLTDGYPTGYNVFHPDGHGLGHFPAEFEPFLTTAFSQARLESNRLKAAGSHILAVGIGDDINSAKLRLISGNEQITTGGDVGLAEGDWTMVEFNELKAMLEDFVTELCAPSVNITKTEIPADGPTRPGDGWDFTLDLSDEPAVWESPDQPASNTAASLTTAEGKANFKWENASQAATTGAIVTEASRPGWLFEDVTCSRRNYETNETTELTVTPQTGVDGRVSWVVPDGLGSSDSVNCAVTNRQITGGQIDVRKLTEPAGAVGTFDFSLGEDGQELDSLTGLGHGDSGQFSALRPGTYSVSEQSAANYDLATATCDDLGTDSTESVDPAELLVAAGQHWECTFVNTAQPGSITVVKKSLGADGAFSFTSDFNGGFQLTTSGGTASTGPVAVQTGTYSVVESAEDGWVLDSAVCSDGSAVGAVAVAPGEDVTCTFTNVAPSPTIQVTKSTPVDAVDAPGASVTFTVGVTNASVEPIVVDSVVDSVDGGAAIDLTTLQAPLTATDCGSLGTLAAGATDTCTFTLPVLGQGGDTVDDIVTVTGSDGDGNEVADSAAASVRITGVLPVIEVTKTDDDASVEAPGGTVTYAVSARNGGLEPVTVSSVTDSVDGGDPIDVTVVADPISATSCATGVEIAVGGTYTCTFDIEVTGDGSTEVSDEVTVTVTDDEENSAVGTDDEQTPVVSTSATTVPVTTVPATTAPPATVPATTVPAATVGGATQTPVPGPVNTNPAPAAATSRPLAVTGGSALALLLVGSALAVLGTALVATGRIGRRRETPG